MAKHRTGLHKEISTIFDGVPIKRDGDDASSPAAAPPKTDLQTATEQKQQPPVNQPSAPPQAPAITEPEQPAQTIPQKTAPTPPRAVVTYGQQDTVSAQSKVVSAVKDAVQIGFQKASEFVKEKLLTPKPGVNPARQRAMVVLVPALFIVLIIIYSVVLSPSSPQTDSAALKLGPTAAMAASDKIDWKAPEPYPANLRDPMQFGSVTKAENGNSALVVKGIVFNDENPAAVIGTQVVRQGETIFGVTVVKINKDSVEFKMNNERWTQKVQR